MGENLRAIDAFPIEGVVWHAIGIVPRHLLGEEMFCSSLDANLGKCAGVAKSIW